MNEQLELELDSRKDGPAPDETLQPNPTPKRNIDFCSKCQQWYCVSCEEGMYCIGLGCGRAYCGGCWEEVVVDMLCPFCVRKRELQREREEQVGVTDS